MNHVIIEILPANKISVTIPGDENEKATDYLLSNTGVNLEEDSLMPGYKYHYYKHQKKRRLCISC